MKKIYLNEILSNLGIALKNRDAIIKRVKPDIKKLGDNTLIFHLSKDEEINQEDFKKYKDCYIITDQPILKDFLKKDKYIFVENINKVYKDFINYYRNLFNPIVIAITGTCGKTTTKEMIVQVLKNNYNVVNTICSKNNLKFNHDYLMKFNDSTEYGVFETAITHPGHLILDCEIYKPQIGIITNIGIDHLNWCKTMNNYIRTKAEMLVGLKNRGHLIINNDDDNIRKIDFSMYKGSIITFGTNNLSDYYGKDINYSRDKIFFNLVLKQKEYKVRVPGNGIHNVYNALAALACLNTVGMGINDAIFYLEKYIPIRSHTEVKTGINKSTVIDDSWSSNPTSMSAALDVLSNLGKSKQKIAIIGKISYLGKYKKIYYKMIAKEIVNKGIDILITIDDDAKEIGDYALSLGMSSSNVFQVNKKEELKNLLNATLTEKSVVLFKTSMIDKNAQEIMREVIP